MLIYKTNHTYAKHQALINFTSGNTISVRRSIHLIHKHYTQDTDFSNYCHVRNIHTAKIYNIL